MRSTTFTRLALLASLAALPVSAETPTGCFARNYEAQHLKAHPDQVVASMTLSFDYDPRNDFYPVLPGATGALLHVVLADQGQVACESAPDEGFPNGFGGAEMSVDLNALR